MRLNWLWRLGPVPVAVLIIAATLVFSGTQRAAEAAPGDVSGVFPSDGLGLIIFGGGTPNQLGVTLNANGCPVLQLWATPTKTSGYISYTYGAPSFVNAGFLDAHQNGIPANTPLLIVCVPGTPRVVAAGSAPPGATAAATATATAAATAAATATATATPGPALTVNSGATSTWQMQLASNSSLTPPPSPYNSKRPVSFRLNSGQISGGQSRDTTIEQDVTVTSSDTIRGTTPPATIRV